MYKILIAVFSLLFFACKPPLPKKAKAPEKIENWKSLDEPEFGIQYPRDWVRDQGGPMGSRFVLFAPLDKPSDIFKENVNLLTENLPSSSIDATKYGEITEPQIKSMITNAVIIESKTVKGDRGNYYKMVYTGDQGVFRLRYEQYYIVAKKKAWVITFTCEQSSASEYTEIGEKILNSFYLKN